ncbi:MAG TPA: Fe-S protein assembly co-chaperone HscB, partial [Bryobacteraceae bacterium]|nr:Fe-S protein assembly co-chaperone HscB [Bryobacteraceae bacterium]
ASGCWKCGQEPHDSLFCKFCNTLQPPAPDYYRFFGLDRRLSIDAGGLQKRYYSLSRLVHPDRFQNGTPNERRFSLDAAAILNDAYRTLRDPVARAEYVLKEEGIEAADRKSKRVPPELIEEVFEVKMSLEEWRGGDHSVRPALESALGRFRSLCDEAGSELEVLFAEYDRGRDRDVLVRVRNVLDRRSYISNLIDEIEEGISA